MKNLVIAACLTRYTVPSFTRYSVPGVITSRFGRPTTHIFHRQLSATGLDDSSGQWPARFGTWSDVAERVAAAEEDAEMLPG